MTISLMATSVEDALLSHSRPWNPLESSQKSLINFLGGRLLPHDLGLDKWKKRVVWMDERCFTGKMLLCLCATLGYRLHVCVCTVYGIQIGVCVHVGVYGIIKITALVSINVHNSTALLIFTTPFLDYYYYTHN